MAEGLLLTRDEYWSIRRIIDVTLTEEMLPVEVIEDQMFLPLAEISVFDKVPDAASKTGTEKALVKAAVVYMTAALILPSYPRFVSEELVDMMSVERELTKIEDLVALWLSRAETNIALLIEDASNVSVSIGTQFVMGKAG